MMKKLGEQAKEERMISVEAEMQQGKLEGTLELLASKKSEQMGPRKTSKAERRKKYMKTKRRGMMMRLRRMSMCSGWQQRPECQAETVPIPQQREERRS